MNRIIAATATAVVLVAASGSAALAGVTPPQPGHYGHTCLAQMRALRKVSAEAGITIGSAFIAPQPGASPAQWSRQLDRAGLFNAGRAAVAVPFDIAADQAFVRDMTHSAADILDGQSTCSSGLPLN